MRLVLAMALASLTACGPSAEESHVHDLPETVAHADTDHGAPTDVASVVSTMRGPGDGAFSVALRTSEMTHYPCASCHEDEGGGTVALPAGDLRNAHADVTASHPEAAGAQCFQCHNEDDLETLALENGESVSLDHAYSLCGQCHFAESVDWAGGAHGKRLGGWAEARVVKSCTDCHDPHRPAFEPRIPLRGPTIPRTGKRR